MKKATLGALVILALASSLLVWAQGPPGPPEPAKMAQHRVAHLTTMLNLTPDQQSQATTLFTNAAQAEAPLMQQMRAAHASLRSAAKSNNTAAIDQAATTVGNLTAQMIAIHTKADAAFNALLTADQQAKFAEMEFHGPGMHMRGPEDPGPGGDR
jgi:Spy/CpxP family protein refolding chaperone